MVEAWDFDTPRIESGRHAPPVAEHQDLLGVLARAEAVRDHQRRAVLAQPHERLLDACVVCFGC